MCVGIASWMVAEASKNDRFRLFLQFGAHNSRCPKFAVPIIRGAQSSSVPKFRDTPIFALQMKANLMNVTGLRPTNYDEHRWYLKLKCSGCGELYAQWQYANVQETHALIKGKGVCHISSKCSLCGRTNTLEILTNSYAPYLVAEGAAKFQTIAKFDCRGIEPVGFDPRIGWRCVGAESGTPFEDVDLNEMEWADYDEKAGEPVEINEMTFQFVPVRE